MRQRMTAGAAQRVIVQIVSPSTDVYRRPVPGDRNSLAPRCASA